MRALLVALLPCVAVSALAGQIAGSVDVEADLRRMTHELMDAIAPGQADVWRRYLHEKMLQVDENGIVRDKEALLKELTPLPADLVGRIEVDKYQVTIYGDVAVAAVEMQEYLDYYGQNLRTRFRSLDTWVRTPEGWRLIGQHMAAVLKEPPAIRLTRDELCAYAGVYHLTPTITTTIRCTEDGLRSERVDRPSVLYLPELRDLFFAAGQPRSRRVFNRDASGKVIGFSDRREGEDVRWTRTAEVPR
jgi:Domain of unknown function (DUF4440)